MKLKTVLKRKFYALLLLILVLIFSAGAYFNYSMKYPFKVKNNVSFQINNGDNLYSVIDRLKSQNVIKNKFVLKLYIKYKKVPGDLKPGLYSIRKGESSGEFFNDIRYGDFDSSYVKVTIPEGYDIERMASLFDEKGLISKKDFIKACESYSLPDYIKDNKDRKYNLEGYLFPDTYAFKKGSSGKELIDVMLKRFNEVFNEAEKETGKSTQDVDGIITMASIIEREAKVNSERPIIASVFFNRLKMKMKLQSCATVEYSLGYHKDKLSNEDLKVNSKYNTYLVSGMPVGPICSPGKASIEGALNPSKTNYIYFVSNNNGTHTFTNSYTEFLKAKKKTQGF